MSLPLASHALGSILLAALQASIPGVPPTSRPARIILIRHAEKPADSNDPHLSQAGVRRANQLVSFIRGDPTMATLGPPVAVFATKTTKDGNGQRTQETVAPLAKALGLPVRTPFRGKEYDSIAKLVLRDTEYAGKNILICWNHEQIPQLAAALGVEPKPRKWKDSVYDLVYVISYQGGKASLTTSRYGSR